MPRIYYRPELFDPALGPALSAPGEIVCGWDELCRAAVTVGRRNWADVIQHGTYSILEALWRLAMLRANVFQDVDDTLKPSRGFLTLDRSEKGAVSYFLGLCFTKLIADRLFDVPWLLHLDVYRDRLNPNFSLPFRPDFVGTNGANEWLVLESKGRSWSTSLSLMETAKRQTRSLRYINGSAPVLRVAVATRFAGPGLSAWLRDPEDFAEDAQDLPLPPELLAREYYRPIVEYLEGSTRERSVREPDQTAFVRARLAGMDGWIGIDEDILEWYHGRIPWNQVAERRTAGRSLVLTEIATRRGYPSSTETPSSERLFDRLRLTEPHPRSLDGITVELGDSWREEIMRRQPGDRAG